MFRKGGGNDGHWYLKLIFHAAVAGAPDRHQDIFVDAVLWRLNIGEAKPVFLTLDPITVAEGVDGNQKGRFVAGGDIIFFQHAALVFLPPVDFFCLG